MTPTRRYNATAIMFWRDQKIRKLSEDGRTLAFYFLTVPERATEGFYRLPRVLALDDLGWHPERFEDARAEIEAADFARYDDNAQAVFIVKALKYHEPKGVKQIRGAVNAVDAVQDAPELFSAFLAAADRYAPELAGAIRSQYGIRDTPSIPVP